MRSLTLLIKGDVVRNLLTAVNIFPSNVATSSASRSCEHPSPMSLFFDHNTQQSYKEFLLFCCLLLFIFPPFLFPQSLTRKNDLPVRGNGSNILTWFNSGFNFCYNFLFSLLFLFLLKPSNIKQFSRTPLFAKRSKLNFLII